MLLNEMRSPEKIGGIPEIFNGLVELCMFVHSKLGSESVMYEIGSYAGESAEVFAKFFRLVHCVDPWGEATLSPNAVLIEQSFDERCYRAGNMIKHRCGSLDMVTSLIDGSIDFAYIDAGTHSYEICMRDIKVWWPKIRIGGFLSGHDYPCVPTAVTKFPGVKQAVDESFEGREVRFFPDTSWLVMKES